MSAASISIIALMNSIAWKNFEELALDDIADRLAKERRIRWGPECERT